MSPESEKRRARAGEDLALALFLADRDPLWAVVALFYGVHHLLIALSQERAPEPFTQKVLRGPVPVSAGGFGQGGAEGL